MMRIVEPLAFGALALAVHLAALWSFSPTGMAETGTGTDRFAVLSGDLALAALVAEWDRPPELDDRVPTLVADDLVAPAAAPAAPPSLKFTPGALPLPLEVADQPDPPRAAALPDLPPKTLPMAAAVATRGQPAPAASSAVLDADWGGAVLAAIRGATHYPAQARARGQQGRAVLALTLRADGTLEKLALAETAGALLLDQAALDAVRRVGQFPPAPAEFTKPRQSFLIPLKFNLN